MIIGLSGYIGSGKDTVGQMIQYLTTPNKDISYSGSYNSYVMDLGMGGSITSPWQIKKFAGKLKEIASILTGIPVENFEDQEFKKQPLDRNWTYETDVPIYGKQWVEMTVREFLQKLGTEAIRNGLHQNAWVNALFTDYVEQYTWSTGGKDNEFGLPNWIITDTRFSNEAEAIKTRGGVVVRVEREKKGVENQQTVQLHASETGLDDWKFDYVINNNGTLEELLKATKTLLNNIQN